MSWFLVANLIFKDEFVEGERWEGDVLVVGVIQGNLEFWGRGGDYVRARCKVLGNHMQSHLSRCDG